MTTAPPAAPKTDYVMASGLSSLLPCHPLALSLVARAMGDRDRSDLVRPSASPIPSALRAVARNLGWLLASRGVLAALSLIYLAIAARTLGIADFGRFALISGAAQAIATLVGFQTWQVIVRYGIDHDASGNANALHRLVRACLGLDFVSAVAGLVIAVAIIALFGEPIGITPELAGETLAFVAVQLFTIRATPVGVLRLRDRFGLAALADSVTPVVRCAGAIIVAFVMPDITGFLIAWAAAELATALAYWVILARTGDLALFRRTRHHGSLRAENPGLAGFILSTNAGSTLGLSSKQLPLLLVGGYAGPAAAGAFRLAVQLANALAKLSQLLARAAFPEIVRLARNADPARLRRVLGQVLAVSTLAGIVILLVVTALGEEVLVLIGGEEYAPAYLWLVWLAAAGCVDLATVGFEPVLLAVHRAWTALAARTTAVAIQLALSFALLPTLGALGVSIGVMVGSTVTALLLGIAILRFGKDIPALPEVR